jgi:hypothetical protein
MNIKKLLQIGAMTGLWMVGLVLQTWGQHCTYFRGVRNMESINKKYRLVLFNDGECRWYWDKNHMWLVWQENEKEKTRIASHVLDPFYEAYSFASPTGNGFLLTGLPLQSCYGEVKKPLLLAFYTPQGESVIQYPIHEVLTQEEIILTPSCGDVPGKGCCNFYSLPLPPRLSQDGYFVEIKTPSQRAIHFFLPLAMLVAEKKPFERQLYQWLAGKREESMLYRFPDIQKYRHDLDFLRGMLDYPEANIRNAVAQYLRPK